MPWNAPVDPVGGTVITVAYAVSNMLDPIRWLRLMTGNADPPGSSYVPVSSSTTAVAWGKVPGDALGAGAAVTNLGYTPVNKAGDSMTGALGVTNLSASGTVGATGNITSSGSIGATGNVSAGGNITTATGTVQGSIVSATSQVQAPSASISGNMTAASATVNGTLSVVAVSATSVSATSNITAGGSISATGNVSASGNITANTGTIQGSIVQALSSMNIQGNAVYHAGMFPQPTATPGPNRVPMSDGNGKLDAWVTASGGGGGTTTPIPPGLIAFAANAGSVPTGWTPVSGSEGRFVVGIGSSGLANAPSFGGGANNSTGDWRHAHTADISHTHSGAALGVAGSTGGPSSSGTGGGTGATFADGSHTHGVGTLDVSGNTDSAGNNNLSTTAAAWYPPAYGLVMIRKD